MSNPKHNQLTEASQALLVINLMQDKHKLAHLLSCGGRVIGWQEALHKVHLYVEVGDVFLCTCVDRVSRALVVAVLAGEWPTAFRFSLVLKGKDIVLIFLD